MMGSASYSRRCVLIVWQCLEPRPKITNVAITTIVIIIVMDITATTCHNYYIITCIAGGGATEEQQDDDTVPAGTLANAGA